MEHKFDIKQMEHKPVAKKQESIIIKICKKPQVVDEVFPEGDVDTVHAQESFILDKTKENQIDRNDVLKRLNKLMNGQEVEEFKVKRQEEKEEEKEEVIEEKEEEEEEEKEEEKKKKEVVEKPKKPRLNKKQQAIQEGIQENMVVFSNDLFKELTKTKKPEIIKASSYYMTNRRMFVQKLNSLFKKHAEELSKIDDANVSCEKRSTEEFETLTHQKVVTDYLNLYSPYRGLMIYHGLGSGKTCTSIAVAEGMKSIKQVIVLTPASLKSNFFSELKKCGDDIYRKNQYWVKTKVTEKRDALKLEKVIHLDEEYIMRNGVWLGKKTAGTTGGQKFEDLSPEEQNEVDRQLDLMIRKKYTDINYNGLNSRIMDELTDNNKKNPFDHKVVIIDEVHNFVSRIVNKLKDRESISYRLYDYLMNAQNAKLVFLTGTPIINYPNEIAILFNMLRGYIKTWTFQVKQTTTQKIDRDAILKFFERDGFNTHDYVEYSGNKVIITRNPFGFVNVSKKSSNDDPFEKYSGVALDETGNFMTDSVFKERITKILNENGLEVQKVNYDPIRALPDDTETFIQKFIDPETGNLNNADLFKRRILGLTSYFKSAQEKLLPKYDKNRDFKIIRIPMSDHQLAQYSLARKDERTRDKNKMMKMKMGKDMFDQTSTYRIYSRELCNFAFPTEYPRPTKQNNEKEENEEREDTDYLEKIENALAYLEENGDQYLSKDALQTLSPKFLHLLENIDDEENEGLHLVYSQFRTIEGIGILRLILKQNGFAEFKLEKNSDGAWDIGNVKEEDRDKPKFVLYTGTEEAEQKEIIRNIYNSNWSQVSKTIRNKLEKINANNYMGEVIKIFMITSSGAEGINLENTRFVHIAEPYWHPVRMEQVIGRAKRICSHKNLPEHLRNIKVFLYLSTLSPEQLEKNVEIRTTDDGKTTDEYLYELANTKERINKQILDAVKTTAMDCSLYKGSNDLVCYNFGKVSSNLFSTVPILEQDSTQNAELNVKKTKISGVIIEILGKRYIAKSTSDRNTKELYEIDPPHDFVGTAILENGLWRIE
jgi:hypothetical protein